MVKRKTRAEIFIDTCIEKGHSQEVCEEKGKETRKGLQKLRKEKKMAFVSLIVNSKKECTEENEGDKKAIRQCLKDKIKAGITARILETRALKKECKADGKSGDELRYCVAKGMYGKEMSDGVETVDTKGIGDMDSGRPTGKRQHKPLETGSDSESSDAAEEVENVTDSSSGETSLDDFSRCVVDSGAMFYGADWCPHCKTQKELLGEDLSSALYVNCEKEGVVCKKNNIIAYPTWVFKDDERLQGTQSLEAIANATNCTFPADTSEEE